MQKSNEYLNPAIGVHAEICAKCAEELKEASND